MDKKKQEIIKILLPSVYKHNEIEKHRNSHCAYLADRILALDQPQNKREQEHKVKVKYPKIREVLQRLYSTAYTSGKEYGSYKTGDGYDFSSAYQEIEKILDQPQEESKLDFVKREAEKAGRMLNDRFLPQEEIEELDLQAYDRREIVEKSNEHTRAINKLNSK